MGVESESCHLRSRYYFKVDTMGVESESCHLRSRYLRLILWWWRVKVVT